MSNQNQTVEELQNKIKTVYCKIIRPKGQFVPPNVLLTFLSLNGEPLKNILDYNCIRTRIGRGRIQYDYTIRMIQE